MVCRHQKGAHVSEFGERETVSKLRERETVSVEEAAVILGVGRNLGYQMAHEYIETGGERGLPVLQCHGRRLRVPVPALLRLLGEKSPSE